MQQFIVDKGLDDVFLFSKVLDLYQENDPNDNNGNSVI
jgi:hypothetical protein